MLRDLLDQLIVEIRELEDRIKTVEKHLETLAEQTPVVDRLRSIPGVGLFTATALVGFVGDDEVGAENFFLFGKTAEEVKELYRHGYRPRAIYESNVELREAIDYIVSGTFWHQQKDLFRPPIDSLLNHQLQPHNRSFANNI